MWIYRQSSGDHRCGLCGDMTMAYAQAGAKVATLEEVHQKELSGLGPCHIPVNGADGNNPRATTDNEYQHEAKEGQKTIFDLDASGVDFVFKLNFQGALLPTQVFAKDMVERKHGCILNISSMNAYIRLKKSPPTQVPRLPSATSPNGWRPTLRAAASGLTPSPPASW